MSFITRCPSCGTAFRVVTDQLRISEGWVRCGHCQHVFDATLDLQPWWPGQQAAVPEAEPQSPEPTQAPAPSLEPDVLVPVAFESSPEPLAADLSEAAEEAPASSQPEPTLEDIAEWPHDSVVTDPVDLAIDPVIAPAIALDAVNALQEEASQGADPTPVPEPVADAAPFDETRAVLPVDEKPAFVRQAEKRAVWRSPWVRAALVLLAFVLLLGVLLQLAVFKRDELASRIPVLRPALQAICLPLGCAVNAPRSLQSVSIDSSALRRSPTGGYIFEMVVKNASNQVVLTPALELTLTDAADRAIVRRVLPASEWPQSEPTLAPGSERPVRLEWQLAGTEAQAMSGYRALLFYP